MTGLLASVTGPDEALLALEGGADLIDLKDPARGALGAVSPAVLAETLACVGGRRPVSAVAGDLPMTPDAVLAAVSTRAAADFVKIGLFPAKAAERRAVIEALAKIAGRTKLIAVFFADGDPDFSLLPALAAAGFAGAMVDTMGKREGRLLTHLSLDALGGFLDAARRHGLIGGLAGSLEAPDVPRLLVLRPDYLGFRGALTAGGRADPLDAAALAAIRALIPPEAASVAPPEPGTGAGEGGGGETDLVFVRDFVLDMEVGAYGFERGRRQRVRFGVEADIARPDAAPLAMADVYSYDIITDAVRSLVAKGHTDLVETLAEDLAATILADRRILSVRVRVEKLDLGPGAVGVEIRRVRRRPNAAQR